MVHKTKLLHIFCYLLLYDVSSWTSAEVFTAISDVEPLLKTHKRIIDDLDDYISKEEKRLKILKKQLNIYKREHYKAMEDIPNYLGNPINTFTLIKRLTTDLDFIEDSINEGTDYIKNVTVNHEDVMYPALEDLAGAAQALTRLQETYHLQVEELAEGMLNGVRYSFPMSAGDCYELARALYSHADYKNSLEWMKVAYKKFKVESQFENHPFTEVDILDFISFSLYMLDNIEEAFVWTEELLKLDPNHTRAHGNLLYFKMVLAEEEEEPKILKRGDISEHEMVEEKEPEEDYEKDFGENEEVEEKKPEENYEEVRKIYEALCRGEMNIPSEIANKLKCRYLTENHPFLKYASIKMEEMYLDPTIVVFHGVMSDAEIEFIQEMAKPRFERAVVVDYKTGGPVQAQYRISKSSWLRDEESPIVERISRRVADMTGLSMTSAEELQVVNYGIGGHYEPHYDFSLRGEMTYTEYGGNRIATVLFYMSDVAQGGATVFTELGLSLLPEKGAAAFWMNLHPSGEGDLATRHAACPVLRGSKWVSNKWIHQEGQEFLKPCTLEYQDEAIIRKTPRPLSKTSR